MPEFENNTRSCYTAEERQLYLLSDRPGLETQLRSELLPFCEIVSVPNVAALLDLCGQNYGSCGVVDVVKLRSGGKMEIQLACIHRFVMTGRQTCLIGLLERLPVRFHQGHHIDEREAKMLLQVGFTVTSPALAKRIGSLAMRYWNSLQWPPQNITDSVIRNLPWRAIE